MATTNKTTKSCNVILKQLKMICDKIEKTIKQEQTNELKIRLGTAKESLKQAAVQINITSAQSR